jgi:hypothetical protein
MTKVTEVFITTAEHPGTPQEAIEKLVALGWEVAEEKDTSTSLFHPLVPGSTRIVHR